MALADGESILGTTLSHYRVVDKIGAGGMGEVYRAEDVRLGRTVALKVLPAELTQNEERKRRFAIEAKAAAAIDHPNVAAVYDIDDAGGRTFIVMEYAAAHTLREKIKDGSLEASHAVRIAAQIADALANCHDRGVVHRDLKPENILLTPQGQPKLIDFGLAKLRAPIRWGATDSEGEDDTSTLFETREGVVMGTLAYMSPEQAEGISVDARSDIFSLGVILHELLSGTSPFRRTTAAGTLSAVLKDPPPPLKIRGRSPPARLRAVLTRCLAKDRGERYQSAAELRDDLHRVAETMSAHWRLHPIWWIAAAATALAAALGVPGIDPREPPAPVRTEPVAMLIADFENRTGDSVFDGAFEQALGIGLEVAPFITVYSRPEARRIAQRLDPEAGSELDERLAQLVCRSEGIGLVVSGVIESTGEGFSIQVETLDPVTSEPAALASTKAPSREYVLKAADDVASRLRAQLGDLTSESEASLAAETFTTTSLEAMHAYARAQELYSRGEYEQAMAEYRRAIANDPEFGRAYAGLAAQLRNLGHPEEADEYLAEALARLDRMTERERYRTRGIYFLATRNTEKAVEDLAALVERYPADSAGHSNLALAYFYQRNMKQALEYGRRAIAIYPKNLLTRNNAALYSIYDGDFETGEREARRVLEENPSFLNAFKALALAQTGRGNLEEAAETYRRMQKLSALGASFAASGLADLALYDARVTKALEILDAGIKADLAIRNRYAAASKLVTKAYAHTQRGEPDPASAAADRGVSISREQSVLVSAARVYVEVGRAADARAIASELHESLGSEGQAYARLIEGELLLAKGDAAGAASQFRAAQQQADTWLGRLLLGRANLELGAYPEAHSELERCLERRGEAAALFLDEHSTFRLLPQVHYYLGLAQRGLGSTEASTSFRRYLSIREPGGEDPLLPEVREQLSPPAAPGSDLKS